MRQMTVYSPIIYVLGVHLYFRLFFNLYWPALPAIDSRTNNNEINITVCQAWYCIHSSF